MNHISRESHPIQRREEGKERENEDDDEDKNKEEEKSYCEWDFNLTTIVSSNVAGEVCDTLGAIEFDPSEQLLATGGIARKIRIYSQNSLVAHHSSVGPTLLDHTNASNFYICTPAKLSSIRWRVNGSDVIGSGDYDGVITEYDLDRRLPIFERDEHGGRRVWSIDYSRWAPPVGASGSDDGTSHVWDPRGGPGTCVAILRPSATSSSVCCVEFDPLGGPLIAMGSADRNAYAYDARNMSVPLSIFSGHGRTVSYVRFMEDGQMVTAATDGQLKLWDVSSARVIRTYNGHTNTRRFVGLSVWRNGCLIGSGSESNEVYVYDRRWATPIWVRGFETTSQVDPDRPFVSSVCWRQASSDECTLVAGGSDGHLQVFRGQKRATRIPH